MSIEHKHLALSIKSLATPGTFEGWLSTNDKVDSYQDLVMPGAFRKTLAERGNIRPLLWSHQMENPIGKLELTEKGKGLWAKGTIVLDVEKGREAYALLRAGVVTSLSIGYTSLKEKNVNGVRQLHEVELYEGSLVVIPANANAIIESIKRATPNASLEALHATTRAIKRAVEADARKDAASEKLADTIARINRTLKGRN